jgi:hypothetical protein
MLPYACLDSVTYTHELRVYYSTQTQDLVYGTIERSWTLDRVERGRVLQKNSQMYSVAEQNTWNDTLTGQTEEDLRIDSQGNLHAPSEVLVTFLSPHYIDTAGPRKGLPTTYELRASSPVEGPFGEVLHFDIQLVRSIDQNIELAEDD